jgi:hypothetical protein
MTAVKKPSARRVVFDATYGEKSLNNGTPSDLYLGQPIDLVYPKIEEFRILVLKCGKSCQMWKRDLSSFFLQIPLDPVDFPKVVFIWRSVIFFFLGLMFGLRHSGYQGQRITNAVTWVHRDLGRQLEGEKPYNSLNYSDDIAGVESEEARALSSANALAKLLTELGLKDHDLLGHSCQGGHKGHGDLVHGDAGEHARKVAVSNWDKEGEYTCQFGVVYLQGK